MNKKLVLFDIDGILVRSQSRGVVSELIEKHFGVVPPKNSKYYAEGKTYRMILIERLMEAGIENPERDKRFSNALKDSTVYSGRLRGGEVIEKIPYVEDFVKLLIKRGHSIGLLTGNTNEISKVKLEYVGLWDYFKMGAFGSESIHRSDLIPLALKNAKKKFGKDFSLKDVFLIGDTLQDINCAKEGNVKIIAVATGKETANQLKAEKPDFLFKDFSKPREIIRVIEE